MATFNTKNKTQNIRAHGLLNIVKSFRNQKIEPKTNTMVKKTRMLRFCNQTYKKRKQCRGRCFEQETKLQKPKQVDKTNVDQKRQLYTNNQGNRKKRKYHQKRP